MNIKMYLVNNIWCDSNLEYSNKSRMCLFIICKLGFGLLNFVDFTISMNGNLEYVSATVNKYI